LKGNYHAIDLTTDPTQGPYHQLEAQVQLTDDEKEAVKKYSMGKEVLYLKDEVGFSFISTYTWRWLLHDFVAVAAMTTITVDDLVKGKYIRCTNILEMNEIIDEIKKSTGLFKQMLDSAAHFGGEEAADYR